MATVAPQGAASEAPVTEMAEYLGYIAAYDKAVENWHKRSKTVLVRFKEEAPGNNSEQKSGTKFNILWSNTQLMIPACFSAMPQPDVSRRFRDNDPVGRVAALLLERALEFELKHYDDFRSTMRASLQDRFLPGRGTSWVRYEPHFKPFEAQVTDAGPQNDGAETNDPSQGAGNNDAGDDAVEPVQEIAYECSPVDYVGWADFGHQISRTWSEVGCVWRIVYLSKTSLVERFGQEVADSIPLNATPEGTTNKRNMGTQPRNRAKVYELWDKERKRVVWLTKGVSKFLDERDDPLKLEDFWPCPMPLWATITNDSLIPTPDFAYYQDQANELDTISDRIDGLIKALKVRGVHNAAFKELGRLFTEAGNNDLIPVTNWPSFSEGGGIKGAIDLVDLAPIVAALQAAYEARKECVDQIYEITGIGDVLRGVNDPQSTATAERMKGQFGTMRLRETQRDVAQYAAEIIRIKAQIMCTCYQPEYLAQIGGAMELMEEDQQYIMPAIQMLRDRVIRDFRIEVDTDSMVQMDETQEKADRVEFLGAVGGFMEKIIPLGQQLPAMAPIAGELFKYGITGFKVGKTIEGALDSAIDQLRKNASAAPPPDPHAAKAQADAAANSQKLQQQAQYDDQRLQAETAAKEQQARIDAWLAAQQQESQQRQTAAENAAEAQRAAQQAMLDAHLERERQAGEERMRGMERMLEMAIAQLNTRAKIEVAEIGAGATLDAAQVAAAAAGSRNANV